MYTGSLLWVSDMHYEGLQVRVTNTTNVILSYFVSSSKDEDCRVVCICWKVILSHLEVLYLQGSPETNQERLVQIPAGYIEAYKQFTHKDSHVVSLAYKLLPDMPVRFSLFNARNCANCLRIFMTVEKQFVSWWTCDLILHRILIKLVAQGWHSVSNNKEAAVITGTCMIFYAGWQSLGTGMWNGRSELKFAGFVVCVQHWLLWRLNFDSSRFSHSSSHIIYISHHCCPLEGCHLEL